MTITLVIRVTNSFNATTALTAGNMKLTQDTTHGVGSQVYSLTDAAGVSFANLGKIPMALLDSIMPGRHYYLRSATISAAVGVTLFGLTPSIDAGGTPVANDRAATTDPAVQPRITNLLFDRNEQIVIEASGATGVSTVWLNFEPVSMDKIVADVVVNGMTSPSTTEDETVADNMPWAPTLLAGDGALSVGLWNRYDGSAGPYALTIPSGNEGEQFGVAEVVGDDGIITLTPSGGQSIENPAGTIGSTAAISCPLTSILYKYDEGSTTWRILDCHEPQQIPLAPAADAAAALTYRTGSVTLLVTAAATVAISTTTAKPRQEVSLWAKSVAGGGSYTLVVTGGTLTLNATNEGALVRRNEANTAWDVVMLIGGATIV